MTWNGCSLGSMPWSDGSAQRRRRTNPPTHPQVEALEVDDLRPVTFPTQAKRKQAPPHRFQVLAGVGAEPKPSPKSLHSPVHPYPRPPPWKSSSIA